MTSESEFIELMRLLAVDPAARGLQDDAAVLEVGGRKLVVTTDMLVEGVHYLADDPAEDVAWKLVAVNLSDLAAKGARPLGVLLGYSLDQSGWDLAFAKGFSTALGAFGLPLLGGDTVKGHGTRTLTLTAIGEAAVPVPSRAGGRAGDRLWVTGSIGDSAAGLRSLNGEIGEAPALIERYRNPRPRLEAGERLAPVVHAMMDVSDGLLLDASRLAAASGLAADLDLAAVPLSEAYLAALGGGRLARLAAATGGDDYELLFAAPADAAPFLLELQDSLGIPLTPLGTLAAGEGLRLRDGDVELPLPGRLGWEHGAAG